MLLSKSCTAKKTSPLLRPVHSTTVMVFCRFTLQAANKHLYFRQDPCCPARCTAIWLLIKHTPEALKGHE